MFHIISLFTTGFYFEAALQEMFSAAVPERGESVNAADGREKLKRFSSELQKCWELNTLTFKKLFLSGLLHRRELSIDLQQHTRVWGGDGCW